MLELRITVLRDKPQTERLDEYAIDGYNLFHDTDADVFFLTDGATVDFELNGFGSDYHRSLHIPFEFDGSYLKAFKDTHSDVLKDALLHDEILVDALALSHAFSTRVLCVYSNDEDCDFAVTAENGKLVRLRFKAGRAQSKRITDDIAKKIKSEIDAVRILTDGEDAGDEGVFEYTAYEVLQAGRKPPKLLPFWKFREGEIGGRVVFETLSSSPEGAEPNLMFRNAFLEFKAAFGRPAPDFTDIADAARFRRVASKPQVKISTLGKGFNFLKSFLALLTHSRKTMMWTFGVIAILAVAIFGNDNDHDTKQTTFAEHCAARGGAITGGSENMCQIDGNIYRNWNLPGETGERRIMLLSVGPDRVPCKEGAPQKCLSVDGAAFSYPIEGFTHRPGRAQIVPVERVQICDPGMADDCAQDAGPFRFKQLLELGG